jgi:hypothetical protein
MVQHCHTDEQEPHLKTGQKQREKRQANQRKLNGCRTVFLFKETSQNTH